MNHGTTSTIQERKYKSRKNAMLRRLARAADGSQKWEKDMSRATVSMSIAAVSVLVLAACTTTSSNVRVDKADVDLAKCQTFDWLATEKEATSLTDQRVRTAALAEIERKGYTLGTESPDCHITYALSS